MDDPNPITLPSNLMAQLPGIIFQVA